ncbi:helix-turn-helix transcriptional regulator [Nocardiopsis sp. N85]|uniref:helix-turn-helix transcriptional regulator n=1 Tax=Nocardiopsis sp. N85 TaxID=3029400 RepID=UPI00237F9B10|nr:helix-turn-helix transcriptional regulator [Nocardiopsis sp. N85]MDE3723218.1 helix-turn-helix transcriptional regulator [Nocardiopsis sp. N85]
MADIAAEVFVSPFHFSRLFTQEVGISPGRYLGAVRMFEAKRRLVASSMNICDIVHSVGYSSVGTFTSRFTRLVGMSPREYRKPEVGRSMVAVSKDFNRMPSPVELAGSPGPASLDGERHTGSVRGMIELPRAIPDGRLLVGVYDTIVPQNRPVAYRFLPATERVTFTLGNVPGGEWSLMALAMRTGAPANADVLVGTLPHRLTVRKGMNTWTRMSMRRLASTDVPMAISLADTSSDHVHVTAPLACGR